MLTKSGALTGSWYKRALPWHVFQERLRMLSLGWWTEMTGICYNHLWGVKKLNMVTGGLAFPRRPLFIRQTDTQLLCEVGHGVYVRPVWFAPPREPGRTQHLGEAKEDSFGHPESHDVSQGHSLCGEEIATVCVMTQLLFCPLWAGKGAEATLEGREQGQAARCPEVTIQTNLHTGQPPSLCRGHLPLRSPPPTLFLSSQEELPSVCPSWPARRGPQVEACAVSTLRRVCCRECGKALGSKGSSWNTC